MYPRPENRDQEYIDNFSQRTGIVLMIHNVACSNESTYRLQLQELAR